MKATKTWLISAAALALTACGGGSNSTTPSTSATVFPVESVIANLYSTAQTFSATRNYTDTTGAHTETITWSYAPGSTTLFEGSMRATTNQTSVSTLDGVQQGAPYSGKTYYSTGPVKSYGWTCNDGSCYGVQNTAVTLPVSSAAVGAIGTAGSSADYTSPAKTTVQYTSTDTISLSADTATTAWLCLNSLVQDTGVTGTRSTSECYKIDTVGAIHGAKIIVQQGGISVTYQ